MGRSLGLAGQSAGGGFQDGRRPCIKYQGGWHCERTSEFVFWSPYVCPYTRGLFPKCSAALQLN